MYALRIEFLKSKMEVFDAVVVFISFTIDIIFTSTHGKDLTASFIGDFIIVLRLWRIVRVVHGIVLSVTTPIEHNLEKEKRHREELETELQEVKNYVSALEDEILKLRGELQKHHIPVEISTVVKKVHTSSE
ncbi:voltage-gated hydrogen channel 1-like protein [Dinothrombium tinctorium]|uniref:Voltage-gated hydrogen channel 1-like protein n=1 Tax=Dinothrombium tinctorium TaxID=1965070 RepID=A0A3S3P6F8_9ACAR|nr:voltage-gated hydrogen channel 1-like protein [Dinothrombium tinctorium]